jgi:hypothetical protein
MSETINLVDVFKEFENTDEENLEDRLWSDMWMLFPSWSHADIITDQRNDEEKETMIVIVLALLCDATLLSGFGRCGL